MKQLRQKTKDRIQKAKGKRQKAKGKRQKAKGKRGVQMTVNMSGVRSGSCLTPLPSAAEMQTLERERSHSGVWTSATPAAFESSKEKRKKKKEKRKTVLHQSK